MDNIKNDEYYLNKIIAEIDKIISYMEGVDEETFFHNEIIVDSVCFRIVQIQANFDAISDKFKRKNSNIDYIKIRGFRNRLVHEYGHVDFHIVYMTAVDDIPELRKSLVNAKL